MSELPRLYGEWLSLLAKAGYSPRSVQLPLGDDGEIFEGFLALK